MRELAQGQFWTPRPVGRAWGTQERGVIAKPAAGAEWKWVAPAAYLSRLVCARIGFTTSAQAPKRYPGVGIYDPNGVLYYEVLATDFQEKSTTGALNVSSGLVNYSTSTLLPSGVTIPEMLLLPEWYLEGVTSGLQTEDQFAEGHILFEQFEPNPRHPVAELEGIENAIRLLERAASVEVL